MNGGAVGTGEAIVFWVSGTLAVIGALGMVISRKAVHSALFIALTMINLAILYVANSAPFLGMVQIIVYTGAVMMLFLFVLMVVGVDSSDSLIETIKGQRVAAFLLGVGFSILLIAGIGNGLMEIWIFCFVRFDYLVGAFQTATGKRGEVDKNSRFLLAIVK